MQFIAKSVKSGIHRQRKYPSKSFAVSAERVIFAEKFVSMGYYMRHKTPPESEPTAFGRCFECVYLLITSRIP